MLHRHLKMKLLTSAHHNFYLLNYSIRNPWGVPSFSLSLVMNNLSIYFTRPTSETYLEPTSYLLFYSLQSGQIIFLVKMLFHLTFWLASLFPLLALQYILHTWAKDTLKHKPIMPLSDLSKAICYILIKLLTTAYKILFGLAPSCRPRPISYKPSPRASLINLLPLSWWHMLPHIRSFAPAFLFAEILYPPYAHVSSFLPPLSFGLNFTFQGGLLWPVSVPYFYNTLQFTIVSYISPLINLLFFHI